MNNTIIYTQTQYKKALKELLVILKYIPKIEYEKLPEDLIKMININADPSYDFCIDEKKDIKDQNISELTKAMLENFYRDYWVTDIERKKIIEEEYIKRDKLEKQKKEKYNPDDIFKNNKKKLNYKRKEEESLIIIKKESWINKVSAFIKRILNR